MQATMVVPEMINFDIIRPSFIQFLSALTAGHPGGLWNDRLWLLSVTADFFLSTRSRLRSSIPIFLSTI